MIRIIVIENDKADHYVSYKDGKWTSKFGHVENEESMNQWIKCYSNKKFGGGQWLVSKEMEPIAIATLVAVL